MKLAYVICLLCFVVHPAAEAQSTAPEKIEIVLPKSSNTKYPVNFYIVQLIEEAFASQNMATSITYSAEPMNEKRAIYSLQHGQIINLYWLSTDKQLEQDLRAIKIPLYKGLHGKRVLLINSELAQQFSAVTSLDQLKNYVGLQQQSWSDYEILVKNGLNIDGSHTYHTMHKALNDKLGDYFPRSALTILSEYQNNRTDHIMVESTLLLQYPNDYYFFTRKNDETLAGILESGLQQLISSGRFEVIFNHYFAARLDDLNLQQRKVLYLKK